MIGFKRVVKLTQTLDNPLHLAELRKHAIRIVVSAVEQLPAGFNLRKKHLAVFENPLFLFQRLVFAGAEMRIFDILDFKGQHLFLSGELSVILRLGLNLAAQLLEPLGLLTGLTQQLRHLAAAPGVEQPSLRSGLKQRVVFVLRMNIDKVLPDRLQLCDRHRKTIDAAGIAAVLR